MPSPKALLSSLCAFVAGASLLLLIDRDKPAPGAEPRAEVALSEVLAHPDPQQRSSDVRQHFADWTKSDARVAMEAADAIGEARQRTVARLAVVSRLPNVTVTAADARRWMERWPDEPTAVLAAASDLLAANIDQPTHPHVCDCAECAIAVMQP